MVLFAANDEPLAGALALTGGSLLLLGLMLLAGLTVVFLPTLIAVCRGHPYRASIAVINICFAWTLLGWAGAMVWAVVPLTREPGHYSRPRRRIYDDTDPDEPPVIRRPGDNPFAD